MLRSVQFFLSAEVWERVSEHGYRKMAVQALAPIGEQERVQQREEEARKSEFVATKAFAESSKCRAEILNFSQA